MPRFAADEMLGKLARWLRVSGIDVTYARQISDGRLIRESRAEGRTILTRDMRLIERLKESEYLFIKHDHLKDQLAQFYRHYPQLRERQEVLSRCLECNTLLQEISKDEVQSKVWPYIYQTQESFTTCSSCGRIYWHATHVDRIKNRLEELLEG